MSLDDQAQEVMRQCILMGKRSSRLRWACRRWDKKNPEIMKRKYITYVAFGEYNEAENHERRSYSARMHA